VKSYKRIKQFLALLVTAMLLVPMLAACGGDVATATPVPPAAADTATSAPVTAATATTAMAADTPTTAMAADTATSAPATAPTATTATTGISPTTGTKPAPAPTITPVPPVPQAAGSTKLTFWYGLTGFNGNVVQQVVNKYNSSQTKYYVDAIQQPNYDDTINKLNTSLAGGNLPNIVQIYDIGTQRMIDSKRVVPVQDFIDKEKSDIVSDIEPQVAAYYTVNGKLYSMPFNSSAPVMYYDKNAFKAAGLDPEKPPTTYDEVFADAQKLTQKDASGNVTRYGVEFTLYGWILEQEIATQGALYADPDNGRGSARATKLTFNNQAGQNWVSFLKKTVDAGVGKSVGRASGTTNGTTLGADFSKGSAAITFESIATLRGWSSQATAAGGKVDIGVAYLPKPDASAPGGVIIGGASLWITDQGTTDQQQGAWEFLKFASQPDIQAFFASSTGYYPTRKSAYDDPAMKDALQKYPQFQIAVNELRSAPKGPPTAGAVFGTFAGTRVLVEGAMEDLILGKAASAQAALDAAASKANDNLDEYNSTVK
jgi:sn-glycerol 3-phosphate transport system substrate-binding protein